MERTRHQYSGRPSRNPFEYLKDLPEESVGHTFENGCKQRNLHPNLSHTDPTIEVSSSATREAA